jgi:hypothetical protein
VPLRSSCGRACHSRWRGRAIAWAARRRVGWCCGGRRVTQNSSQNDGQLSVADQGAAQLGQAEMEVSPALVAGAKPFEGVQPGEAALDHPPPAAQAGAVGHAAASDPRSDASARSSRRYLSWS